MNPAALKANIKDLRKDAVIIINSGAFDEKNLAKAGCAENPLETDMLNGFHTVVVDLNEQVLSALKEVELDNKSKLRCKNFFALGITYEMFGLKPETSETWINWKFSKAPTVAKANVLALEMGMHYAEKTVESVTRFEVSPAKIDKGTYRQINGNTATAWGLMQAAESAKLPLFLGSYPITPATDILHELSKYKHHGVKTYQAEDEIAGICSAIGAGFGGALAVTTTSGPGLALKGEALGLAAIYEIPLVIVNVQRGGPSTGLPTKTEQSDLNQALYGRNGECPMIIVAASRPNDCYHMAYEAARLSLEHMTPCILLTDGYVANGAEPWKIPDPVKDYPQINHHMVDGSKPPEGGEYLSYARNEETLARPWAVPGMKGYEHRIGGLEKENLTGCVSHNPQNHQLMTELRQRKVDLVQNNIPLQELEGDVAGDVLVISWGGTYGATHSAVRSLRDEGKRVTLCHMRYISPMPKNIPEILAGFKKIIVPELNGGQMKDLLNAKFQCDAKGLNKVQGLPFYISELKTAINKELESL
jgi:2-oxoglutarate ferredoxin oxidoreductase subunit alpha